MILELDRFEQETRELEKKLEETWKLEFSD